MPFYCLLIISYLNFILLGDEWTIPECGEGEEGGCGGLFDFTTSTVRLAPPIKDDDGNPINDNVRHSSVILSILKHKIQILI